MTIRMLRSWLQGGFVATAQTNRPADDWKPSPSNQPVTGRFFRFTALQEINGNGWTSAAEIPVLPANRRGD